ncbi:MAG: hypothetical protein LUG47_05930, partial [Clostridiales bacterium]|nr:hypothetical protein [Clostridiales bacterium]
MTERRKEKRNAVDLKRIAVAAVALLMALMMVVPLVADVFLYGFAYDFTISQEDIDSLVEQKEALAEQQAEAQAALEALQDQEDSAVDRLNAIEDQLDLLAEQINATQEIIDQYDEMIAATQESLAEAQAQEEVYYNLFLERVRSMEEEGTISYLEILFNAASFSDLLDRWSFINDVMQYDNDIMDGLEAAQKAVASYETQLEEEQAAQEETKAQLLDEQAEQEDAAVEQQAIVAEILENQDTYAAQITALSNQQNDLVGEISEAEEQLAAEQAAAALEEEQRRLEEEAAAAAAAEAEAAAAAEAEA